jgi:hypothetical protein
MPFTDILKLVGISLFFVVIAGVVLYAILSEGRRNNQFRVQSSEEMQRSLAQTEESIALQREAVARQQEAMVRQPEAMAQFEELLKLQREANDLLREVSRKLDRDQSA